MKMTPLAKAGPSRVFQRYSRARRASVRWKRSSTDATVLALAVVCALAADALAIRPGTWVHDTEEDFAAGKTEQVVVTNLGDLKLSAATTTLAELPEQATIVYDIARAGDTFMAAGPEGKLLRYDGQAVTEVLSTPNEQIFCLDVFEGRLLVAVSGDGTSRLTSLADDGQLTTIADLPDVRYVWDMAVAGDKIYVATGTEGKLLQIDTAAEGEAAVTVLLDAEQDNLLCLGIDGQGRLYAGSDGEGLIHQVTIDADGNASSFVVYDAAEPEIGAMLVKEDGTVFAGTSDADQAKPNRLTAATKAPEGRPGPGKGAEEASEPQEPLDDALDGGVAPEPDADSSTNGGEADEEADPTTAAIEEENLDEAVPDDDESPVEAEPQLRRSPRGAGEMDATDETDQVQAEPTAQQHDALRERIRQWLTTARDSDDVIPLQVDVKQAAAPGRPTPAAPGRPKPRQPSKKGNAIYHVDPDGFVEEIFRESVMILRLVEHNGALLVATGNEGQLYRLQVGKQETTIMADLEPQQLPAMVKDNGAVWLGTANPASLLRVGAEFAPSGTYTSEVLDAAQVSLWGRMHLRARTPDGTAIVVETRSGNVEDPDQAAWSRWSKALVLEAGAPTPLSPRELEVNSPPARFWQYRTRLESDGAATPAVDRLELAYVTPNLRPRIESIKTQYGSGGSKSSRSGGTGGSSGGSSGKSDPKHESELRIEWKASDANNDRLGFELRYRPDGSEQWLTLAEDLDTNRHAWQTKVIPDGRYLIRLRASDRPDNTPDMELVATRDSDPIVVDNTPPSTQNLQHQVVEGTVQITGVAVDALSPIANVQYMVDGEEPWQPVLPKDLIYDSTRETFLIRIQDLAPGPHVIAVRTIDALHNARYDQVLLDMP